MSKLSSNLKNGFPFKMRVIAGIVTATLGGSCYYAYNMLSGSSESVVDNGLGSIPHTDAALSLDLSKSSTIEKVLPGADIKRLNSKKIQDTYKHVDEENLKSAQNNGSSYVSQLTYEKSRDLVSYVDYLKSQGKTASFELALKWMGPANPKDYKDFISWTSKQENKKPSFHNYILWLKVERTEVYSKFSAWAKLKDEKLTFKSYMTWLSYITSMSEITDFDNFMKWANKDGRKSEFSDYQEWLANAKPDEFNKYQKWLKDNNLKPSWETYSKFLKEKNPKAYSDYQKWLKENNLDDNYDNYAKFIAESNRLKNGTAVSDYTDWLNKNNIKPNSSDENNSEFSKLLHATDPALYDAYQNWLDFHGLEDTPENYKKFLSNVVANSKNKVSDHKKLMNILKSNDPAAYAKYLRWLKEKGLTDSPEAYQKYLDSLENNSSDINNLHKNMIDNLKSSDPAAYKEYQDWLKLNGLNDSPEAYQKWLKEKALVDAKKAHAEFMKTLLGSNPELYNKYKDWLKKNNLIDSPEAYQQFLSENANKDNLSEHKMMMDSIKNTNPDLYNAYQKWLKDNGLTDSPESYRKFLESMKYDGVTNDDTHKKIMAELKKQNPLVYNAYQKWLKDNGLTDSPESYQKFLDQLKAQRLAPYHTAFLEFLKNQEPGKYGEYKKWLRLNQLPDSAESFNKFMTKQGLSKASADALHKAFLQSLKNSDRKRYDAYLQWLADNNLTDSAEAYQKFLDSLAPSHSSYMKWLKDNNVSDSSDAYQNYLNSISPEDAEKYKQWLQANGLDNNYSNYLKYLAAQEDALNSILGNKDLCSSTSLEIFSKAMYAANQQPTYINFRNWMKVKSSCGDAEYQDYLSNESKIDSFTSYESFLQKKDRKKIEMYHDWINLNALTSSWTNYLYWSLSQSGLSAKDITGILGENTSNFLTSLDCKAPTFIKYSEWAGQHDDLFKGFIISAGKLQTPATFPNFIKFMQTTSPESYDNFNSWAKSKNEPTSFSTFIQWKASTEVAGLEQCSIESLEKAGNISGYFDYVASEGLGMNYKSLMQYLSKNDPEGFNKYKEWLRKNGKPDNEQSYLEYLAKQNPELMAEYQKWLKDNGLEPSIKTLAMFKAQKEGVNPRNKALRRLTQELKEIQRKKWKDLAKSSLELQKGNNSNSESTISNEPSQDEMNFARINKEIAYKKKLMMMPPLLDGEFINSEMQKAQSISAGITNAVKLNAKEDIAGGTSDFSDTGAGKDYHLKNPTGLSKDDRFFKDRTPNYANLDAVKRAKRMSEMSQAEHSQNSSKMYPTDHVEAAPIGERINAGTILYSTLTIGVNTDEISRIKSVIIEEGPLKGAVLLGTPMVSGAYGETAVIQYNKLILNNQEYSVDAYAVDPKTMRTTLSGEVDNHIFERYSKLGIAAFMSGYAESLSSKSESKNTDGSKETSTGAIKTAKDRATFAAGKMMTSFIPFFEKGFDRPATVKIPAGSSIGIMFASGFNLKN